MLLPTKFKLGVLTFEYLPDGDDPGVGFIRVSRKVAILDLQATREQWDKLLAMATA